MKRLAAGALLSLLLVAAVSCGDSKTDTSSTKPTNTTAGTMKPADGSGASTTAMSTNSGGDAGDFCTKLADETEKTAGFAASIGTPQQAAKMAEISTDNASILAAAPSDIHDAIAKVYAVSETSMQALSATDKVAAAKAATDAMKDPAVTKALADYSAWVKSNCADKATKILAGGL